MAYKGPKKALLIKTIEEMNTVLGFEEDPIPTTDEDDVALGNQTLLDSVGKEIANVEKTDQKSFSKDVWEVLTDIEKDLKDDGPSPKAKGSDSAKVNDKDEAGDKGKDKEPAPPKKKKDIYKDPSKTTRCLMMVCENPDITVDEMMEVLSKDGVDCAKSTAATVRTDVTKVLNYLKRLDS